MIVCYRDHHGMAITIPKKLQIKIIKIKNNKINNNKVSSNNIKSHI